MYLNSHCKPKSNSSNRKINDDNNITKKTFAKIRTGGGGVVAVCCKQNVRFFVYVHNNFKFIF